MYHEILSIAADDRDQATEEMLNDLARQYLSTRAPDCLAYARAQFDTRNPHIHIMISAHRLDGGKVRLSKFQFQNAKRQLERYQQEHYPELEHSLVQTRKNERTRATIIRTTPAEAERIRRERTQGKATPTRKAQIRDQVRDIFTRSRTDAELIESLVSSGFVPYLRGNTPGVIEVASGRKYRLKTLGLEAEARERMVALKIVGDRERAIREMLHDQARTEERERTQGRDDDLDDDLEYPAPLW
jgi:Relaxase/Mobilisation nuclease domain